jgi:hypothetical protein
MPEQTSGILPEQYLKANLANGRELRNQPHIGLFKHFLQHAVQFSRSLLLASLFSRLPASASPSLRHQENLVHPLRQLGQNDLSGPFEPSTFRLS